MEDGEMVLLEADDRIGWTYSGDVGIISYNLKNRYDIHFREIVNNEHPVVGNSYGFTIFPFPIVFSIGVSIKTCIYNTGVPGKIFHIHIYVLIYNLKITYFWKKSRNIVCYFDFYE